MDLRKLLRLPPAWRCKKCQRKADSMYWPSEAAPEICNFCMASMKMATEERRERIAHLAALVAGGPRLVLGGYRHIDGGAGPAALVAEYAWEVAEAIYEREHAGFGQDLKRWVDKILNRK